MRNALVAVVFYSILWVTGVLILASLGWWEHFPTFRERLPFLDLQFLGLPERLATLVYLLIPAVPLAIVAWFYRGRKRDHVAIIAVILLAVLPWIPWLDVQKIPVSIPFITSAPYEEVIKKARENYGLDVCGVYEAPIDREETFVYEEVISSSSPKKCLFLVIRPFPRYFYHLVISNASVKTTLLGEKWGEVGETPDHYTFVLNHITATPFLLGNLTLPPPFEASVNSFFEITFPVVEKNTITLKKSASMADDWVMFFYIIPEQYPEPYELKLTVTIHAKAVVY